MEQSEKTNAVRDGSLPVIRIRRMYPEDIGMVTEIEKKAFSEPWKEQGFEDAIMQRQNIFLVAALEDETVVGYCGMYGSFEEGDITNVAVKDGFRGNGIGVMLIEGMKGLAAQQGIFEIFLEVRASNEAARRLYEKTGFEVCGRRKDFYRKPTEDAILMCVRMGG